MASSSILLHGGNLSVTRRLLRRAVMRSLKEGALAHVPAAYFTASANGANDGTNTSTTVVDATISSLLDGQNFKGAWLYVASTTDGNAPEGEERRIISFEPASGTWTVAPPFSATVQTGDTFEIHQRTSATQKHEALNRAVRYGWPYFFDFAVHDAVMCLGETVLSSGKGLPSDIRRVIGMELEPLRIGPVTFTATGGGAGATSTITNSAASWTSNQYAGYSAAIVDGTGQGQQADVLSNTSTTLTLASLLDTQAALGSVVYLKPPALLNEWEPLDPREWATFGSPYLQYVRIPRRWQGNTGRAVRITYLTDPTPMSDEDDATTNLPQEYLVYAACTTLALEMTMDGATRDVEAEKLIGSWNAEERDRLRESLRFDPALLMPEMAEEKGKK